ncbi:MAG: YraN family protein [Defluviitaleaceae bacterium]|nr:YraN family protein [Defluviitaleaceae bacterium]
MKSDADRQPLVNTVPTRGNASDNRPTKYAVGMDGQQAAEAFLCEKGMNILARNYRIRTGEVDLIAQDGSYLVFIEVKTRKSNTYGQGRESVTRHKQQQIMRTAMFYATKNKQIDRDMRFDVVEVVMIGNRIEIEHIENAFWA